VAIRASSKDRQQTEERPFAHLRATPEERARILSALPPFECEAWFREAGPPTPEELAELEEFLRERAEERQRSLACEEQWLAGLDE
jgi:hypothetical protein